MKTEKLPTYVYFYFYVLPQKMDVLSEDSVKTWKKLCCTCIENTGNKLNRPATMQHDLPEQNVWDELVNSEPVHMLQSWHAKWKNGLLSHCSCGFLLSSSRKLSGSNAFLVNFCQPVWRIKAGLNLSTATRAGWMSDTTYLLEAVFVLRFKLDALERLTKSWWL